MWFFFISKKRSRGSLFWLSCACLSIFLFHIWLYLFGAMNGFSNYNSVKFMEVMKFSDLASFHWYLLIHLEFGFFHFCLWNMFFIFQTGGEGRGWEFWHRYACLFVLGSGLYLLPVVFILFAVLILFVFTLMVKMMHEEINF